MLPSGSRIFIQFPEEAEQRLLHAGTVVDCRGENWSAAFDEQHLPLEEGGEVLLFFEVEQRFVKQAARIDALMRREPTPLVGLEMRGETVAAEQRESYRVSTFISHRAVEVGGEADCRLVDLSVTGLAFLSGEEYEVGQILPVVLREGDEEYAGQGRIQSIRNLPRGLHRYGLLCVDDVGDGDELRKGLKKLTMDVQREQLRRRAGTD